MNNIYKRFHIIDDRITILRHNLTRLNYLQNEKYVMEINLKENQSFYISDTTQELQHEYLEKEIVIGTLATRCIDDTENLIIEIINVIDMYKMLDNTEEAQELFSKKFVPFIQDISNLETLFMSNLPQVQELLFKIKLFGKTLQDILHFEIQIEK
jgi:hypothetical protein